MTIREAFANAGCPVHQTAWLVYWPLPNVSDKAWFMLDHNDPKGACFYWLAHGEWHSVTEYFDFDESDLLRGQVYESIDIGDLPVTKFIETLLPAEWLGRYDLAKAEVGS